jgi:hypothetical protein
MTKLLRPDVPHQVGARVGVTICLRANEIRRLRVGCIKRQQDTAPVPGETPPRDPVCFLEVPVNKTGTAVTKPVDRVVGEAVELWEKVRPRTAVVA